MFEGDGCEGVDTLPGDLVLVLRQKPNPLFRRVGEQWPASPPGRGQAACWAGPRGYTAPASQTRCMGLQHHQRSRAHGPAELATRR